MATPSSVYPASKLTAMPRKITDDEHTRIVELLGEGHSHATIGRQIGRSASTVGNIARSIGHRSGQTNLARAHEARSAYCAERRASLAARFTEECEELLEQLHRPHLAYNFGGKDNTYEEHELSEPGVAEKRMLIQAAREAMRTVLDIDRHDNRADVGGAAVDQWLRDIIGSSTQGA